MAMAAIAALTTASRAAAQETATPSTAPVNIEAQSLASALFAVSDIFGVSVFVDEALVRDMSTPAVNGNLTIEQTLNRLLADSGLTANREASGAFVLIGARGAQTPTGRQDGSVAEAVAEPLKADTIVVTGTKQNRSIKETVESVAVITADDIVEQTLINVDDIFLRTANVSSRGDTLNDVSIRGINLQGVGNTGEGATAQTYLDGVPLSLSGGQGAFNLWDIEQVEILRGPQSTTQGRNALAGAVVIQSADPKYEFGGAARALYGNENQLQGSAMITGPIIPEQLAFRIAIDYREVDFEVVDQDSGDNTRFEEALSLRGKLLFEPEFAPGLRLELIGSYVDTDFGDFGNVSAPPEDDPRFASFDPFGRETFGQANRFELNEATRATIDLSYELSPNWTLRTIGAYEDIDRDTEFGQGGNGTTDAETYSAETRIAFEYDRLTGWVGGYYFNQTTINTAGIPFSPSLLGFTVDPADTIVTFTNLSSNEIDNYALFGDVTYDVTDRLRVNFGARYDFEDVASLSRQFGVSDPTNCIIDPSTPRFGGLPCNSIIPNADSPIQDTSYEAFLPRGSIAYDVSDDVTLGFLVARGYRAGGSYLFATPNSPDAVVRSFDPEFVTSYELSLRSFVPGLGLTLNANAFYTDWTDQQITIPGSSGLNFDREILNAGSSEIYGVEVEANVDVTKQLNVFATLGLVETEFQDFAFATTGPFENLAGNEFDNAPNVTASLGMVYKSESGFFASANGFVSGSAFSDVTNLAIEEADDFVLVNARVGYRLGKVEIALFADNLFNDRFIQQARLRQVDTDTGAINPRNPASLTVNEPRLFGVEVRAGF